MLRKIILGIGLFGLFIAAANSYVRALRVAIRWNRDSKCFNKR
jgi:hypothetical protein